jgi:hypothetical protein
MTPVSSLGRGLRARHICGALLCFLLIPLGVDAAPRKLDAIAADPAQWPMPSKNHASTR